MREKEAYLWNVCFLFGGVDGVAFLALRLVENWEVCRAAWLWQETAFVDHVFEEVICVPCGACVFMTWYVVVCHSIYLIGEIVKIW